MSPKSAWLRDGTNALWNWDWNPHHPVKNQGYAPPHYPSWTYKCPITGVVIPKALDKNLEWRRDTIQRMSEDHGFAQTVAEACRASLILTTNLLFWTFRTKTIQPDGTTLPESELAHAPFITYPYQDYVLSTLNTWRTRARSGLCVKSRIVGWSYALMAEKAWLLQFHRDQQCMILSHNIDKVDNGNDRDTLFWKLRYMLGIASDVLGRTALPAELSMEFEDVSCRIGSSVTGSAIKGESTDARSAHGGRSHTFDIDEGGLVRGLRAIFDGARDNANSTRCGGSPKLGSEFNQMCDDPYEDLELLDWPWYTRPEVMHGLRRDEDPNNPDGITSNWLECEKRSRSLDSMNENIYRVLVAKSDKFVDPSMLRNHRAKYITTQDLVYRTGHIAFAPDMSPGHMAQADDILREQKVQAIRWIDDSKGPWRILCPLFKQANGRERPDQNSMRVIGGDIGNGVGGSDTVFYVGDVGSRTLVAEFCSNQYKPEDAGRILVAAGIWFGSMGGLPLLGWETNGPGGTITTIVNTLRYQKIYRHVEHGMVGAKATRRIGFHSKDASKSVLFSRLRDAVAMGDMDLGLIVPFELFLDQFGQFVNVPGAAAPVHKKDVNRATREMEQHGDRVMAAGITLMLMDASPKPDRSGWRSQMVRQNPDSFMARQQRKHAEALQRAMAASIVPDFMSDSDPSAELSRLLETPMHERIFGSHDG